MYYCWAPRGALFALGLIPLASACAVPVRGATPLTKVSEHCAVIEMQSRPHAKSKALGSVVDC